MSARIAMYSSGASSHLRSEAAGSWLSPDRTLARCSVDSVPESRHNFSPTAIRKSTFSRCIFHSLKVTAADVVALLSLDVAVDVVNVTVGVVVFGVEAVVVIVTDTIVVISVRVGVIDVDNNKKTLTSGFKPRMVLIIVSTQGQTFRNQNEAKLKRRKIFAVVTNC